MGIRPHQQLAFFFICVAVRASISINNLHHLENLLERWRHPLSVAIFAHGQDVKFATALVYALSILRPPMKALVDFHLVCPSGETVRFPEQDHRHFTGLDDCAAAFSRLEAHNKYKKYAIGANVSYPNNLLRNVARGGAESSYILVINIDIMPAADLHRHFPAMVARRQPAEDHVFVLAVFEIRHTRKIPATKAELMQLYQGSKVRPFYEELCPLCQAPTNYSRWVNSHIRDTSGGLEVAYTLTWVDSWEPFYIGPRNLPLYDENFKQYGFNRISQACELHVAGYKFSVLNSAFLVHRGFKIPGEFHARKDDENKHNRLLSLSFKEALKTKYPTSSRRC
ncbi:beta-1,4-glucuronyltransferase 1-like [Phyllopteryx taeniolatus]|uniref:beta-1,4-glucuronyltransferase 1-like n=1 Tax=Phyllopteryx taeniolatus TaxID=161469 RepID=UPI002AD412D6|nr:beta-1,4-glucuronyltransferase 1-like [Phyllopteryx taeniolatus]